jgi:2-aminophenol/2-amino-5-chlorophenol 1,6-dioxygenase alpha subunit
MPHLRAAEPAPSWKRLGEAVQTLGSLLASARLDALLWMSTQWFTVLGHQFQLDPNPTGTRVDENWYGFDFGRIDYDLRVDCELAARWAEEAEAAGLQARRIRYDGFPIDTGTVAAAALFGPAGRLPMAMVSCNLYADAAAMGRIGAAGARAAEGLGRRVAVVAVSGLSSGLIQRWISPDEDDIDPDHDRWNQRILDLLVAGDLDEAMRLRAEYATAAQADSQLRALAFLAGTGALTGPAEVVDYGHVWGTGAAVIAWRGHEEG